MARHEGRGTARRFWGRRLENILPPSRTALMGVLNVTPDSFYDGGRYNERDAAVARGLELAEAGADIIDVGGESTRPGATAVSQEEELERVVPVVELLAKQVEVPISVDTTKAGVARSALDAGASFVNDVSAGSFDSTMLPLVAEKGCPVVLMHMLGTPRNMQMAPRYQDVVREVCHYLVERRAAAVRAGVDASQIILDPGIGFGKGLEHNLRLISHLDRMVALGSPVLVGVSRKTFIGEILRLPVEERLEGTAAAVALAVWAGVRIVRVHDVKAMVQVVSVVEVISREGRRE